MRVLLVKPNQPVVSTTVAPPLGLLYLASSLRERLGASVEVSILDMKARSLDNRWLFANLPKLAPDVIGVSALNLEQDVSYELASVVKRQSPHILTVIGGPFVHRRSQEILGRSSFDWAFEGEAEYAFAEALARYAAGQELGVDIPGFSYKAGSRVHVATQGDTIADLDNVPMPAWDLIDLDLYKKLPNMNSTLKGKKYATIFTSRGCPYKCHYCHDIFGKKFRHRSVASVIDEIDLLYRRYDVDEFQIVDDIFNLHKPRLKQIMGEVARRWPGRLHFSFPNGLRADILDESVLDSLRSAGAYSISVAIETVTPRLQRLVEKNLDVEKTVKILDAADRRGFMVRGFFMLGFPTETEAELRATVELVLKSRLTLAHIFCVTPQPKTPLHDLAMRENKRQTEDWESNASYYGGISWYERVYGFPLKKLIRRTQLRFYLAPSRLWRIFTRVPRKSWLIGFRNFLSIVFDRPLILPSAPPESFIEMVHGLPRLRQANEFRLAAIDAKS